MCGIAGFLTSEGPPDLSILGRMCDRLSHRGPDAVGYWSEGVVALGHRRLSIIDVSGGQQPLSNEDGSIHVVFNGEIYNFRELRSGLVAKGHRFATQSDTEVLVHLFEEVGEDLPGHLNGMFAFAIWDSVRKQLFLARDRFGEKPLYYSDSIPGTRFAFGSELRALEAIPGFSSSISPSALAQFLSLSYVPDPETIYRGIHKLLPASSLSVTARGEMRRSVNWRPQFALGSPEVSLEDLRSLASDSVQRRMISDVPLGAFLSGGVDSSAVVAFMAQHAPDRVKTFSIGFPDPKFNELPYAQLVAKRYSTQHREQIVHGGAQDALIALANTFDEPFGDSSALPMLFLSRLTREEVTVALSGDGADELFGGYRRYRFGLMEARWRERIPEWFRASVVSTAGSWYPKADYLPRWLRAKTTLQNISREIGDAYYTSMTAFRDEGLTAILSPEQRREAPADAFRTMYRDRFQRFSHLSPLEQMQAVDLETCLPGDILVKTDRTTMAYSLEARAPWLDHRLAELAFRLPPEAKIRGGTGKFIFKQALRGELPRAILQRKKLGFSIPLDSWLRTSLKTSFERVVLHGTLDPYISIPEADRLWREHQSGSWNHGKKLWNLLQLGLWEGRHNGQRLAAILEETAV